MIAVFTAVNLYANRFSYNEKKLGGDFKLIFYTSDKSNANAIASETYLFVDSLNKILSNYLTSSEIRILNEKRKLKNPSNVLKEVLTYSQTAFYKTNGYFDISIQPLIKFWRKAGDKGKSPSKRRLIKYGKRIGLSRVLKVENRTYYLNKKSELQLGGIAKGYIIDKVYEFLIDKDLKSFLIEAAGDIRVFGSPEGDKNWTVGVSSNNRISYSVNLRSGQAIATSGKTYRFRIIEGKKYSHIINPKKLIPVTHNFTSSVIADNATTADYLASTFNIVTDKIEIDKILNKHKNVELLLFNSSGTFFETEHFLTKSK